MRTTGKPSFVSKGLLNLDHLMVKKSKAVPEWMSKGVEEHQGREGWVSQPRFRTASEMRNARRLGNMQHISLDVDGDGIVSAEDVRIAARYDQNLDGQLQPDELHALRVGLISETLAQIQRMQKVGNLSRDKKSIIDAVQAFENIDQAVDAEGFANRYQKLKACVDVSTQSVQVRELINPSRTMRGVPPTERSTASARHTPTYLRTSMQNAAASSAVFDDVIPQGDGATPRWLSMRNERLAEQKRTEDEEKKARMTPEHEKVCSGIKTKSALEASRKAADVAMAEHQINYNNFGGKYEFPNSLKSQYKRESKRKERRRLEREQRRSQSSAAAIDYGTTGSAPHGDSEICVDDTLGSTESTQVKWQDEADEQQQSYSHAGSSSKDYAHYLQGGRGRSGGSVGERITGTGTHISISMSAEKGGLDDTSATRHLKAGRAGPVHRGGRLPTPLYDSISVQTFAKPLSMKRDPV